MCWVIDSRENISDLWSSNSQASNSITSDVSSLWVLSLKSRHVTKIPFFIGKHHVTFPSSPGHRSLPQWLPQFIIYLWLITTLKANQSLYDSSGSRQRVIDVITLHGLIPTYLYLKYVLWLIPDMSGMAVWDFPEVTGSFIVQSTYYIWIVFLVVFIFLLLQEFN